jgi:hypothetical protein
MTGRTRRRLPHGLNDNPRPVVAGSLCPASPATSACIVAFSRQPLFGGVMIGAEVGRMTSRFGESPAPKYGGLMAFPEKG